MTYFTIWHYLLTFTSIAIFFVGIFLASREKNNSMKVSLITIMFIIAAIIFGFTSVAIDKYTKKAVIVGLKNKRVLRNETIVYSGYVKNVGEYKIGKVEFEIKLVNRGHATGNVKGGNFYKPSGFFAWFSSDSVAEKQDNRPQKLLKTFVVAKNLEVGKSKYFSVTLPYPGYFQHTSDFTKLHAH